MKRDESNPNEEKCRKTKRLNQVITGQKKEKITYGDFKF